MKVSKKLKVCALVALLWAQGAGAEGQRSEEATLEPVIVTATRTERERKTIPANVTVIDAAQIERSGAVTVVDLMRSQEGVVVRDPLGNGKSASVDVRGFGESAAYNTLVLVDGRRVNEIDLSGVDWTQIPLDQIERIEILRGTGSVLYGDNAVGGVINIITKSPKEGFSAKGGFQVGSYSRHKEKMILEGGKGGLAGFVSVSYDSSDGYRENGELRTRDLGGKVSYEPATFLSLSLSGNYHKDDSGLPGPLKEDEMAKDRRRSLSPLDEAKTKDGYLSLTSDLDINELGSVRADIGYRKRNSEYDYAGYSFASEAETETWSFTPRYVLDAELIGHRNSLIAGLDYYRSQMDQDFFYGQPRSKTEVTEAQRYSYGIYFNDEFYLAKQLIASFGARKEWVNYDLKKRDVTGFLSPLSEEVKESEYAYAFGLTYLYKPDSSVFARVNRSLRFPLLDELILYDYMNAKINVNKALRPQRGEHVELGVKHRFAKTFEGAITLFRASIKDEIFFNSGAFSNENHPKTLHQGFELSAKAALLRYFTILGNYTFEEASFEAEPYNGKSIPSVPKHRANLGLRIHDVVEGLTFAADYNYIGKSYAISDQANALSMVKSHNTVDATLSYGWRFIKGFVAVKNATDEKYSEYVVAGGFPVGLNYYPAPERTWIAGVELRY
jgi:iron complex outermembrane receptor protein